MRRGQDFWDYSIGSITPGKLSQAQLKYLERKQILFEPRFATSPLQRSRMRRRGVGTCLRVCFGLTLGGKVSEVVFRA